MIDFEKEVQRIVNNIVAKYDPIKIILFGSVAQGTQKESSDIDLVVIKDTNNYFYDRLEEIIDIADIDDIGADILVYNPSEIQLFFDKGSRFFVKEVFEKGKVVYDKNEP